MAENDNDPNILRDPTPEEIAQRKSFERRVTGMFIVGGLCLLALAGSWLGTVRIPSPRDMLGVPIPAGRDSDTPYLTNPFTQQQPKIPEAIGADDVPRIVESMDDRGLIHTKGIVTDIVSRIGLEYARVEYYMPAVNMNCYFHQETGTSAKAAGYYTGMHVEVVYDPAAKDACGTSRVER